MSICDDARAAGVEKVEAAYKPFIDELSQIIFNMTQLGLDPRKFYDAKNNKVIDLLQALNDFVEKKQIGLRDVNDEVDKNCQQVIDYVQKVVDVAVSGITAGLSDVLPKHFTHIDVGEILGGKPLGGPNSIFNVIKDSVFDSVRLGDDSPLRRIINNPVDGIKNEINNLLNAAGLPFRL
jgi:hypothetical protein